MSTSQSEQVILITGANRSLGFAILQAIASHLPSATYILACRSPESGYKAIQELRTLGITSAIEVLELDVTSDESIFAAVGKVKQTFGKLDGKSSSPRIT
jgi:NAD(P)-dependent dehydrogenase (short-subunit alcohol dehydrogenase family)